MNPEKEIAEKIDLIERMHKVAFRAFQNHMEFLEINDKDVDYKSALRAAFLAAASRGFIVLTDPGEPSPPPAV